MRLKHILILSCFSLFTFHFSLTSAQQGTWLWGSYGIGDATVWSIASDNNGNCYLAGLFFNDTIYFGGHTLMNSTLTNPPFSSELDAFIVKYDHKGNLLWAKQASEKTINAYAGNSAPVSVCTDNFGNAYLSGNFADTLFIGSYELITQEMAKYATQNTYLAKYDPNGNVVWAKQAICVNDNGAINEDAVSCDGNKNIYVSGGFADTIYLGTFQIAGTSPKHYANSFLAKYDSGGNVMWVKQSEYIGDNSDDGSSGNAPDKFGNIFITGWFQDTVSFGPYQLKGGNNQDFYLIKYDSSGNVKWARQNTEIMGGSSMGTALAADQVGNTYATGQFVGGVVFAPDTLIAKAGSGSFFLVKYDPNGNLLWAKMADVLDNNTWNSWALSIDNSKHLYLSATGGYQTCKVAFGGDTLSMYDTAAQDGASVIFKLDSNGKALCSSITPAGSLLGVQNAIASDTSGNYVYFGASAATVAVFGKDTVNPFAYPINPIQKVNYFPFAARWEECDTNLIHLGVQISKPMGTEVRVYPNPSNGQFTFEFNTTVTGTIEMYNITGRRVYQQIVQFDKTQINLGGQPAGMYFYRAITNTGSLIGEGKVIVEK